MMIPLYLKWEPLPRPLRPLEDRMRTILHHWEGTPYMAGQRCAGAGVDCVRFVVSFAAAISLRVDELPDFKVPQDTCMHSKEKAFGAMKFFLRTWPNHECVSNGKTQPGDILVVGPPSGGPGHAIVVGPDKNTLWHTGTLGVARQGWMLKRPMIHVFRVYRHSNREAWL